MKNLIFDLPLLAFFCFFIFQLFALEPIGRLTKSLLGSYSQHLVFLIRILIVILFWQYLFSDWQESFRLSFSSVPWLIFIITVLYSVIFFPLPIPKASFPVDKVSLHFLISVWEELLMRGLLLAILIKVYPNSPLSVIVSVGCLFGVLHFLNLLQGADIADVLPQVVWSCALGISFAVITYFSGSVVPAIVLHCGFNFIPAIWDGKPWVAAKASSLGVYGLLFIAVLFFPLVALSLKRVLER